MEEELFGELAKLANAATELGETDNEVVLYKTGDSMRKDENHPYYSRLNIKLFELAGIAGSGNIHILVPKVSNHTKAEVPNGSTGLYYDLDDMYINSTAETTLDAVLKAKTCISNGVSHCLRTVLVNLAESANLDFVICKENIVKHLAQAMGSSLQMKQQEFSLHYITAEINGLNEQVIYDPAHKKWILDNNLAALEFGENYQRYIQTKMYMVDFSYAIVIFVMKYILQYSQCLSASNNEFLQRSDAVHFNSYFSSSKYNTIFSQRCSTSDKLTYAKLIENGIETASAVNMLKDFSLFIREPPAHTPSECKHVQSTFLIMFRLLIGSDNYHKFLIEELPGSYALFRHSYHVQDPAMFAKMYVFMRDLYDFLVISNSGEHIVKIQSTTSRCGYFLTINLPTRLVWYQIGIACIKLKYRCFMNSF